jgi:glutamine synthetase
MKKSSQKKVVIKNVGFEEFIKKFPKIKFVEYQFADMQGGAKGVTATTKLLQKGMGTTGVDGSSIFGEIIQPTESDRMLVPDFSTLMPIHGSSEEARVICNMHYEGMLEKPFEGCGRSILAKVVKNMESVLKKIVEKKFPNEKILKIRAYFAPEFEFLLLPRNYNFLNIHLDPDIKNGCYFDPIPEDVNKALQKMVSYLKMMGLEEEKYHSEVATHQYEIGVAHGNAMSIADGTMTIKATIKKVAAAFGFRASFIPKFKNGVNGNGMHVHQNLSVTVLRKRRKERINLFFDPSRKDGLSDIGRSYIAGLLKYAREITAITNPRPISYKRLVPGAEAPTYISWDWLNRTALCRGHSKGTKKVRVEYRSPDPTCNPYLAFAAMLSAGLAGIQENLKLPPCDKRNFYTDHKGVKELPGYYGEALDLMNESTMLRKSMGDFIIDSLVTLGEPNKKKTGKKITAKDIKENI